jgi:plastocyanin
MRFKELLTIGITGVLAACAGAQDITGTILIKKKLTRPSVTTAVSVYQRGTAVKLGKDAEEDPIAYERTRVVVYLEGAGVAADNSPVPALQVQQLDRRFMPDLVVVPVGSAVSFPNMDPIFHNIYSLSKPKSFDLGSYDKGETRKVVFPKPGIVDVYCHLHPNMAATIVVTPNRWYARPDRTGQFRIPNIPPGQYTVVAWHKSAGFFRKSIVVENGHDAVADFFIPLEADAKPEPQANQNAGSTGGSQ